MFSSSSVALEALVLILAYSSNALAEREKIKIKMMTKRYYDNGIIIIAQLKTILTQKSMGIIRIVGNIKKRSSTKCI